MKRKLYRPRPLPPDEPPAAPPPAPAKSMPSAMQRGIVRARWLKPASELETPPSKPAIRLPGEQSEQASEPEVVKPAADIVVNHKPVRRPEERGIDKPSFVRREFLRFGGLVVEQMPDIARCFTSWKYEGKVRAIHAALGQIIKQFE